MAYSKTVKGKKYEYDYQYLPVTTNRHERLKFIKSKTGQSVLFITSEALDMYFKHLEDKGVIPSEALDQTQRGEKV